jgi:hypothetical protein
MYTADNDRRKSCCTCSQSHSDRIQSRTFHRKILDGRREIAPQLDALPAPTARAKRNSGLTLESTYLTSSFMVNFGRAIYQGLQGHALLPTAHASLAWSWDEPVPIGLSWCLVEQLLGHANIALAGRNAYAEFWWTRSSWVATRSTTAVVSTLVSTGSGMCC